MSSEKESEEVMILETGNSFLVPCFLSYSHDRKMSIYKIGLILLSERVLFGNDLLINFDDSLPDQGHLSHSQLSIHL